MNVLLHILSHNTLQRKSKQIKIKYQVTFFSIKRNQDLEENTK